MKNLILFLFLFGCEQSSNSQTNNIIKGKIISSMDFGSMKNVDLYEFEYKGHTYIGCNVHGGKSLTHAGHCKCNKQIK